MYMKFFNSNSKKYDDFGVVGYRIQLFLLIGNFIG